MRCLRQRRTVRWLLSPVELHRVRVVAATRKLDPHALSRRLAGGFTIVPADHTAGLGMVHGQRHVRAAFPMAAHQAVWSCRSAP